MLKALGLIEVMKLFSPVASDVANRVVENPRGQWIAVEYDEPLARLQPSAS